MNHTRTPRPHLLAWGAIVLSALLGVALATVPSAGALSTTPHAHPEAAAVSTPKVARSDFHDQVRKLWEDHITWTRLDRHLRRRVPRLRGDGRSAPAEPERHR